MVLLFNFDGTCSTVVIDSGIEESDESYNLFFMISVI